MKQVLKVLAFPFILFWSLCQSLLEIIEALFAKPFVFRMEKNSIEIGIVPLVLIVWLIC